MQRPMSLEICSSVALRRLPSLPVKLGSLRVLRTRANYCLEFEFESCAMSQHNSTFGTQVILLVYVEEITQDHCDL